jgi:cell fate regulator YaaT (PSP1 superfamily)
MDQTITTPKIVGVRFSKVGKIYHFDASKIEKMRKGDVVIVETSRGWQLGEVVMDIQNPTPPPDGTWKPIERLATPRDLLQRQSWQEKEPEVVASAKARAAELRLNNIKIIFSEYSYDGSRLSIFFSSDSEDKVELRSLRPDMQRAFSPAQVDIRQIGPRDVAKYMGGMGACGMETRCCAMFITEFSSISIRMAKEQGISLTPTEITGMCGRLRCCLIYEYDNYVEARKLLPKKNKRVITPDGEGKVIDVSPLREAVMVDLGELGRREYQNSDLKPAEEYEAFVHKAENPSCGGSSGTGGGCASCQRSK